jgi:hypothetical protein
MSTFQFIQVNEFFRPFSARYLAAKSWYRYKIYIEQDLDPVFSRGRILIRSKIAWIHNTAYKHRNRNQQEPLAWLQIQIPYQVLFGTGFHEVCGFGSGPEPGAGNRRKLSDNISLSVLTGYFSKILFLLHFFLLLILIFF